MSSFGRVFQERALLTLILFLGLLFLDPLIPDTLTNLPFAFIGVASAWILTEQRSFARYVLLVAASAAFVLFCVARLVPSHTLESMRVTLGISLLVFALTLYSLCAALILREMLKATEVNHHQIISTVNLYLILGMFWAQIYTILDWINPQTFGLHSQKGHSASQFIYFSFVTLCTLGYGDITPKTEFAQRLAITEAIMGQFYVAVVVAYLLSIYIRERISARDESHNSGKSQSDRT
jgi:voltage-gated potassium channel